MLPAASWLLGSATLADESLQQQLAQYLCPWQRQWQHARVLVGGSMGRHWYHACLLDNKQLLAGLLAASLQ